MQYNSYTSTVSPSKTTFRFLDVVFFKGPSVVFAVAIACFAIHDMSCSIFAVCALKTSDIATQVAYEEHHID